MPKLENSLRWSFFTLIYNRSPNIWVISYIQCISHYKKILIAAAGRFNVIVLIICSFPWLLATPCRYYIPYACVKRKFQFVTGGNWKSSKRHASLYSIVRFWKPLVSSLYFLYKPNQTKPNQTKRYIWTQVIANIDNNNKTFKHLPNSNWFDHLCFFFLPFKQFISSWSLWGNSTYPDELPRVEIPKRVDALLKLTEYGNWI